MIKIEIDKKSNKPLYIQIRDTIRTAFEEGNLKSGDRLPPVAAFAKEIGVTQATIRRAVKDLSKEGYTRCHVGRGTFITDPKSVEKQMNEQKPKTNKNLFSRSSGKPVNQDFEFAARRLRTGISKGLCDLMSLAQKPGIIHFTKGVPDPASLPEGFLEELVKDALQSGQNLYLETGDSIGMLELRQEIASRFSKRGVQISPDQVLITNGSQQAAAILAEAAKENMQHVICEAPCFKGITDTFAVAGNWVDTIPRDSDGPLPDRLNNFKEKSCLLYICSELHNPMGTDLSPERRKMLAGWAKKTNSVIVADEIFHDLRFAGTAPKSIYTELGSRQSIVISSLSKSFMTGLRVGWMIGSVERIRSFATLKRLMDQACPPLMQGIALSLLRSGKYDAHIKKMQKVYRKRRDIMTDALKRLMPEGVSWITPDGGFSIWLEMPVGYSSVALFLSAIERGVAFLPGPLFDINQRFVNAFRLSYSWVDSDQIEEGIELLAETVKEFMSQPPGESGLSGLGNFQ